MHNKFCLGTTHSGSVREGEVREVIYNAPKMDFKKISMHVVRKLVTVAAKPLERDGVVLVSSVD